MAENALHPGRGTPLRGLEVIEEAAAILRAAAFSADAGFQSTGRYVAVQIASAPTADGRALDALVYCYAIGHRPVAWEAMTLFIFPAAGESPAPERVICLDRHGRAAVSGLPQDDYRIVASHEGGMGDMPVPMTPQDWPLVQVAAGGHVRVTVTLDRLRQYELTAEYQALELGGNTVLWAFVDQESNHVWRSGRLLLRPTQGVLAAAWREPPAAAAEVCRQRRLAFCLVPKT